SLLELLAKRDLWSPKQKTNTKCYQILYERSLFLYLLCGTKEPSCLRQTAAGRTRRRRDGARCARRRGPPRVVGDGNDGCAIALTRIALTWTAPVPALQAGTLRRRYP